MVEFNGRNKVESFFRALFVVCAIKHAQWMLHLVAKPTGQTDRTIQSDEIDPEDESKVYYYDARNSATVKLATKASQWRKIGTRGRRSFLRHTSHDPFLLIEALELYLCTLTHSMSHRLVAAVVTNVMIEPIAQLLSKK
ncbi:hypothetical protein EVAR_26090_1 [Eumeta japonica]|uniref:Uncharacterized protein n=1 Tax=Eumeta variegata TaxID=151549 RepID=A0A4C1X180_EUMVA|nr:hypothetical protein EVAR_26090_1 [Eumeta japonica]